MKDKQKVLIVEDDKFLVRAYKTRFEKIGIEVLEAGDGVEAQNQLEKGKPDLILLDLIMPKKDGFKFLREMVANKAVSKTPVIVLSNLGQESDIAECKELGVKEYLVKANTSMNEVLEIVQKYLKK